MTILYIAGSISDGGTLSKRECEKRLELFDREEVRLTEAGFTVLNPARRGFDPNKSWLDYMRDSLRDIAECDGIAILPNWAGSRGARIEVDLAKGLGLPVMRVVVWLDDAKAGAVQP